MKRTVLMVLDMASHTGKSVVTAECEFAAADASLYQPSIFRPAAISFCAPLTSPSAAFDWARAKYECG